MALVKDFSVDEGSFVVGLDGIFCRGAGTLTRLDDFVLQTTLGRYDAFFGLVGFQKCGAFRLVRGSLFFRFFLGHCQSLLLEGLHDFRDFRVRHSKFLTRHCRGDTLDQ